MQLQEVSDVYRVRLGRAAIKSQDGFTSMEKPHDVDAGPESGFVQTENRGLGFIAKPRVTLEEEAGDQRLLFMLRCLRRTPLRPVAIIVFNRVVAVANIPLPPT